VMLGAIILWEFLTRIQQGIMMAFLEDIWTQNFVNFFASPLKVREYLSGLILTSFVSSLVGFFVMIAIAGPLFGYNALAVGLMLVPFMVVLLLFGIAMGVFVSAVVFRLGPSALPLCRGLLPDLHTAFGFKGPSQGRPSLLRLRELPRDPHHRRLPRKPRAEPCRGSHPIPHLSRPRLPIVCGYLQEEPAKRQHRPVQRGSTVTGSRRKS
jgi:hypothetical protein